jgi:SagB-type dehydrogenase family enzyme
MTALQHRWHGDVRAVTREGDSLDIAVPKWRPLKIGPLAPPVADAILMLREGATLDAMRDVAGAAGAEAVARLDFYLGRFRQARLLEWFVREAEDEVACFRPFTPGLAPAEGAPPGLPMVLSRFACLRREGRDLLLDSAETPCRATLRGSAVAVLAGLSGDGLSPATPIVEALWRMGFLEPADGAEPPERASWEFADRLLHVSSRMGRDGIAIGGTYRFRDRFPAPPAAKPAMSATPIALPAPDVAELAARSQPLAAVLEARASNRAWSGALSRAQLGELLWRVARVKERIDGAAQELMKKPLPGGGAIHELEWYVATEAADGLPAGLHHYDGFAHALEPVAGSEQAATALRERAKLAAGQATQPPPTLVILASRLPRLAWKYQGIAYRISLLNAGVAIQAMYLVATDMGLACSAIGSSDPRPFERATGLSSWEEPPIAEFALGVSAEPVARGPV